MTVRSDAWALFDEVIATAPERTVNPWRSRRLAGAEPAFEPDVDTLAKLLGIPVLLGAASQSGVPALALDVWVAYEFRRAGFDEDALWPRASSPRVMSPDIATLLSALPKDLRSAVARRIATGGGLRGAAGSNANLLGKNYVKQVDVGMSSWQTGPELLVSTKRMDSSFAKNAANRVEESYGDAKNLRLRYPRAALGFAYALRSTALTLDPDKTEWLRDLLAKLGREEDAYDAVVLVIPEWDSDDTQDPLDEADPLDENAFAAAGLLDQEAIPEDELTLDLSPRGDSRLDLIPVVRLRHDAVPTELSPARFFEVLTRRVLDNCPINFHREARNRLAEPRLEPSEG